MLLREPPLRAVGHIRQAGVVRGPVERRVVVEVDGAELGIVHRVTLVGDPEGRLPRRDRLDQDPQVAFHVDGGPTDAEQMQPVEKVGDIRRDEQPVAAAKLGDPLAGTHELFGSSLQVVVDLGDRRRELVGLGGQHPLDPGQRHTRLGQRPDLDQVDGVVRGVPAVPRRVARRLGQQAEPVMMPDGLDRDARVTGQLTDGDHVSVHLSIGPPGLSSSQWHRGPTDSGCRLFNRRARAESCGPRHIDSSPFRRSDRGRKPASAGNIR